MPIFNLNPVNTQTPNYHEFSPAPTSFGESVLLRFEGGFEYGLGSWFDKAEYDETFFGRVGTREGLSQLNNPVYGSSEEEAQAMIDNAGLTGIITVPETRGYSRETIQLLIDRRLDQIRRDEALSRAEDTWMNSIVGFGAEVVGSATEPAGLALSFVPVVGWSRYTRLLAGANGALGRAMVRTQVGFAEGLVGSTLAEPFVYNNLTTLQDDYTVTDSMLNITMGAFFGSALHAGAGFASDTVGRSLGLEPEWAAYNRRQTEARELARQAQQTVEINAAGQPVLREADGSVTRQPQSEMVAARALQELEDREWVLGRLAEGRPLTREQAEAIAAVRLADQFEEVAATGGVSLTRDAVQLSGLRAELAAVRAQIDAQEVLRGSRDHRSQRAENARQALRALRQEEKGIEAEIARRADAEQVRQAMGSLRQGKSHPAFERQIAEEADRLMRESMPTRSRPLSDAIRQAIETDPFMPSRAVMAVMQPETLQAAYRTAIGQLARGRRVNITPILAGDRAFANVREEVVPDAVRSLRESGDAPPVNRGDAQRGSAEVEATLSRGKGDELQRLDEMLDDALSSMEARGLSEAETKALRESVKTEKATAKQEADAVDAITECLLRGFG